MRKELEAAGVGFRTLAKGYRGQMVALGLRRMAGEPRAFPGGGRPSGDALAEFAVVPDLEDFARVADDFQRDVKTALVIDDDQYQKAARGFKRRWRETILWRVLIGCLAAAGAAFIWRLARSWNSASPLRPR